MRAAIFVVVLLLHSRVAAGQPLCPNPPGGPPLPSGLERPQPADPALDAARCSVDDPLPDLAAVSSVVADALDFDFATDPFHVVSASIQFKDDGSRQRLTLAPLKLLADRTSWDGLSLGLVTGGSSATMSAGLSYDQAAPYDRRRRDLQGAFNRGARPNLPIRGDDETLAQYTARVDTIMANAYSAYWMQRLRRTNVIALTGSVQTFAGLAATRVDLDNDGLADNEHAVKGYGVAAQWTHRWSFWTASTLTAQAGERRVAAIENTPLRQTYGVGLSVARTVLILDPDYLLSKDYRSRLYVPAVSAGLAVDWMRCDGAALECEDRVVERWTAMPYADVRLPGGAQFKLGIPFRNDRIGDKTGVRIDPLLQFGWSLASL